MIGARSAVRTHVPWQEGFGTSRRWTRRLHSGAVYGFTLVDMPDGERRFAVDRYEGPEHLLATGTFACDWKPVHAITVVPPAEAANHG